MARQYAQVRSDIWTDPDFTALTAGAQRLYVLLISSATINMCGIVPLTPTRWMHTAADVTLDDVHSHLRELAAARFVFADPATDEVWVRTFIRHNVTSPNGAKGCRKAFMTVVSQSLRDAIRAEAPTIVGDLPDRDRQPTSGTGDELSDPEYRLMYGFPRGFLDGPTDRPEH